MKYFLLAIMIILAALPVGDVRAETVLYEEDMIGPLESPPPPPEIEVEEFPGASLHENPPGDRGPASGPVIRPGGSRAAPSPVFWFLQVPATAGWPLHPAAGIPPAPS